MATTLAVVGTIASMSPAEARPPANETAGQASPGVCVATPWRNIGAGEVFESPIPHQACAVCLDAIAQPDALDGILNFALGVTFAYQCNESPDGLSAQQLWTIGPREQAPAPEPPAFDPSAPPARACFGSVRNSPLSDVPVRAVTASGAEPVVAPEEGYLGSQTDPVVGFRIVDPDVHVKVRYFDLISTDELRVDELDITTPPDGPYSVDICHEAYLRVTRAPR